MGDCVSELLLDLCLDSLLRETHSSSFSQEGHEEIRRGLFFQFECFTWRLSRLGVLSNFLRSQLRLNWLGVDPFQFRDLTKRARLAKLACFLISHNIVELVVLGVSKVGLVPLLN